MYTDFIGLFGVYLLRWSCSSSLYNYCITFIQLDCSQMSNIFFEAIHWVLFFNIRLRVQSVAEHEAKNNSCYCAEMEDAWPRLMSSTFPRWSHSYTEAITTSPEESIVDEGRPIDCGKSRAATAYVRALLQVSSTIYPPPLIIPSLSFLTASLKKSS